MVGNFKFVVSANIECDFITDLTKVCCDLITITYVLRMYISTNLMYLIKELMYNWRPNVNLIVCTFMPYVARHI